MHFFKSCGILLKVGSPPFSEILIYIRDTIYCDAVGSWMGAARGAITNSLKKFLWVKIGVKMLKEYIVKAFFMETKA